MRVAGSGAVAALVVALLAAPAGIAKPPENAKKVGRATLTFYWIVDESAPRYRGRADVALRDVHGKVIAQTSRKFRRALVREGTGWLRDGRAVRYERKVDGEHRFRIARAKHAIGAIGCALVPYRSVAVDPQFVRLGSTIYIPQLKGTRLPDGTVHDGVFVATDRGHFRGHHVDIFVGPGSRSTRPFVQHGNRSRSHITVYMLDDDGADCAR